MTLKQWKDEKAAATARPDHTEWLLDEVIDELPKVRLADTHFDGPIAERLKQLKGERSGFEPVRFDILLDELIDEVARTNREGAESAEK